MTDVAEEMTAIARRRSAQLGLTNVRTAIRDLESIDEPDEAFDAVICREGLMLVLDPARAAAETRRVLRPGGRLAVAVWGPRERNPWLGSLMDAVSQQVGSPVPPPGMPVPFALGDRDQLAAVLTGAGLADVTVTELESPMLVGSFDEWWPRVTALAGPLAKALAMMPPESVEAIRAGARTALTDFETDRGYEIRGEALIAYARRESAQLT